VLQELYPYNTNIGKRLVKTAKIYFTETGLLSWLLQIEAVEQAARDPLLGNIFENMVVMVAVKSAYNRGESTRLSIYRDKSGLVIDLIREYQRRSYEDDITVTSYLSTAWAVSTGERMITPPTALPKSSPNGGSHRSSGCRSGHESHRLTQVYPCRVVECSRVSSRTTDRSVRPTVM